MSKIVRKATASPAGDNPLMYVMSDETVDRVGDVIHANGWQLDSFTKNPVALFGHDHSFVIGHWSDVAVKAGKLIGKLNLLPAGISERIDEVRAAVEAGVLRAVSVGFMPDFDTMEESEDGGYIFKGADLMECSLVAVPANPNALQMAKSLGISDETKSLIFKESVQPDEPRAASGTKRGVVKLNAPARVRAKPFVIKKIHTG